MNEGSNAMRVTGRQAAAVPSWRRGLAELWRRGALDWNLSRRAVLWLAGAPFLIAAAGVLAALVGKDVYKWFTGEDRFAETLQVVCYALALGFCMVVCARLWRDGRRGLALLYVGVACGLIFMVGEELSWGQRIFGWGTPAAFQDVNKQGQTNLHNIYGVGATFKWLQLLVGAYGTLMPLVVLRSRSLDRYRETLTYLAPHFTLIGYFVLLFVWRIYRNLVPEPKAFYFVIADYNEVMELALAMGVALFMWFLVRQGSGRRDMS